MGIELTTYKQKIGADMVLLFKEKDDNVTYPVVRKMHDAYVAEMHAAGNTPEIYMPNVVYAFDNGINFRMFDNEISPPVLEILALPGEGQTKADVMAKFPDLLRKIGVEDRLAQQVERELAPEPERRAGTNGNSGAVNGSFGGRG